MSSATDLLADLSAEQRSQLRALLNAEAAMHRGRRGMGEMSRLDLDIYDALLAASKLRSYQPAGTVWQQHADSITVTKAAVEDILAEGCHGAGPAVRREVTLLAFECLAAGLDERDIPVSPTSLLRSGHLLRSAVEDAYPGYLGAGLLPQVVSRRLVRERRA